MRDEYPRPDLVREEWLNLNGPWSFWFGNTQTTIEVPFVPQSGLSGIGRRIGEDRVVYERSFRVPPQWKGREVLLHFGAVDYRCRVFLNGACVGSHTGGQTSFSFPVSRYLTWDQETVRVEVEDPLRDETIPRGKQFWEEESRFIWYTPSTGIWQTVWLEPADLTSIDWVHFTPDIDEGTVMIEYRLSETSVLPCRARFAIRLGGEAIFEGSMVCGRLRGSLTVDVFRKKAMEGSFHFTGNYWSPEHPVLYDVEIRIEDSADGRQLDHVRSYFGMRKIHVENGRLYLNNQPYFHKLVLDQGYWKDGLITAPSDLDYQEDIRKAKEMGFNGCRKHEKVEDPRFLYWADRMGFLVWEAMASFWAYTPQAAGAFMKEWIDVIQRDYNHPCIVVWGMLNESWGVPRIYDDPQQQSFARALYYMAKGLDKTRLVVSNDGWEMTETDICAIHSYRHGEKDDSKQHDRFAEALKKVESFPQIVEKLPFAKGTVYGGWPVVLTECGGIAVSPGSGPEDTKETPEAEPKEAKAEAQAWGYTFASENEFLDEYARVIGAVCRSDLMNGFCYTQLTDVEQERNGLLTRDHQYKFDPARIRGINDQRK